MAWLLTGLASSGLESQPERSIQLGLGLGLGLGSLSVKSELPRSITEWAHVDSVELDRRACGAAVVQCK